MVVLTASSLATSGLTCGARTELVAPAPVCEPVGVVGPVLDAGSSGLGAISCATEAVPDEELKGSTWATDCVSGIACGFQFDTGGGAPGGANLLTRYGQPACPDQYLVEAGLDGLAGRTVGIVGGWSLVDATSLVSPRQCQGFQAIMTLFGYDGTWTQFDQVVYAGEVSQDSSGQIECVSTAASSEQGEAGNVVAPVPTGRFTKFRAALVATDCGRLLPIDVVGDAVR
jgi:hypothetical protein